MRDVPAVIKNRPYWRVLLRPQGYRLRVDSIAECLRLVEDARLAYRDFPSVSSRADESQRGQHWVARMFEHDDRAEYWRFFRSGQFVYLCNPHEAFETDYTKKVIKNLRVRHSHRPDIRWDDFTGVVHIVTTLYRVTEVFEFAARLAERGLYSEPLTVRVELHGVRGRALTWGSESDWTKFFQTTEDCIRYSNTFATDDLVARRSELALAAAARIFEPFGWSGDVETLLRPQQQEMLKR